MKAKKTLTTKTTNKPDIKPATPVAPDHLSFALTANQIDMLVHVLRFAQVSSTFLAQDAVKNGDADQTLTYESRAKLCEFFINTFGSLKTIGEPTSREFH